MNTRSLKLVALYIVLTAGAVIMVFPIIWTLVSSFKTPAEIMRDSTYIFAAAVYAA